MDSDGLRMLHIFMLQHMLRMSLFQTADIFAAEAGITYNLSEINLPYGFLTDWWNMFWKHYSPLVSDYISNNDGDLAESSAQAEARARIQDQAHADAFARAGAIHVEAMAHVQTVAYSVAQAQAQAQAEAQARAEAEAQARVYAQVQAVAQARAAAHAQAHADVEELGLFLNQAQAQSWAFSNGGRTAQEQYFYTMWPLLQQFRFHGINTTSVGEPALGLGSRWAGEQVSPFQQGPPPFPGINTNSVDEPALGLGIRSAGEQVTLVQQGPASFPGINTNSVGEPALRVGTRSAGEQITLVQQGPPPFPGINTNSVGEPTLRVGTRSAGEQVTLVQQGPPPFPGIPIYPRPIHVATQSSQVLSHMVNRVETGTWEGTTSSRVSQRTIAVTSTGEPPSSEPLDLDAMNEQFNMRLYDVGLGGGGATGGLHP